MIESRINSITKEQKAGIQKNWLLFVNTHFERELLQKTVIVFAILFHIVFFMVYFYLKEDHRFEKVPRFLFNLKNKFVSKRLQKTGRYGLFVPSNIQLRILAPFTMRDGFKRASALKMFLLKYLK